MSTRAKRKLQGPMRDVKASIIRREAPPADLLGQAARFWHAFRIGATGLQALKLKRQSVSLFGALA